MRRVRPRIVYLVRHGETDWNVDGRWQGQTDVSLNAQGREQAGTIAELLRGVSLAGVVSSDLSRAHETARIAAQRLGIAVAYVDSDLRERRFGVFEGLTRDECAQAHPEAWRAWVEEQRTPPGAESRKALTERVTAAIGRAVERVARTGSAVLVVTHGGALRAAVALATGELPARVDNGAIWKVEWEERILRAEACSL
jgi:probable phosphoglycerate mutase